MVECFRYFPPASQCQYLKDQMWQLEYLVTFSLSKEEFSSFVRNGWRRMGTMLFRPRCPACSACQPIRVVVDSFRPNRSQRRVRKANVDTTLVIGPPTVDDARLDLYWRHHLYSSRIKGWPEPINGDELQHINWIIEGPLPVQEWSYYYGGKLIAIAYIDELDDGFSGIYFYYDPDYRHLSPGTWICLSMIEEAARSMLPYVYLGYYVAGCRSMNYKARFAPNQIYSEGSDWKGLGAQGEEP